jgi:hypothetical protein
MCAIVGWCLFLALFVCGCTPLNQSRGVAGSIALERDRQTDMVSPRVGLGYGYHVYQAPLSIPHFANLDLGGAGEVAYAPLTESVEVAAEVRVISPLMLLLGLGISTRTGMRWDPHRNGEGFFELTLAFGSWMPDALPSNYCDKTARHPYHANSYQHCDPATTVTMDDLIDGSGIVYLDVYPIRTWDGGADEALGAQSIETFFAVRGLLSDWVWTR